MNNKKMKWVLFLTFVLIFCSVFTGCSNEGGGTDSNTKEVEETFEFKLSHPANTNHPYHVGAEEFKKLVEERTDGKVRITIYPNNQLGSPKDVAQALQLGTCDMGILGTAYLTSYEEKFGVLDLPFLFKDYQQAYDFLDSKEFKEMTIPLAENKNIKLLSTFSGGFRVMFNSARPINKPKDFEGMKVRIMESQVYIDLMDALGAQPVALPWDDLYTSIQQKICDAAECGIAQVYSQRFFEVTDYLSLTNHTMTVLPLLISTGKWEVLPAEYQEILQNAATEAAMVQRQAYEEAEVEMLELLETEGGMEVNEADTAELQEAVMHIWDNYVDVIGQDLIDKALGK